MRWQSVWDAKAGLAQLATHAGQRLVTIGVRMDVASGDRFSGCKCGTDVATTNEARTIQDCQGS